MTKKKSGSELKYHDDIYEMLMQMHDGCSPKQSFKKNAKLIFLMMNEIDNDDTIQSLIQQI